MLIYNGSTGSLGQYFGEAARVAGKKAHALKSRIEDLAGFRAELEAWTAPRDIPVPTEASFIVMAAKVSVPWCEANPEATMQTNVTDTSRLVEVFLDFCSDRKLAAKLLYVSSAHLYARHDGEIREDDPAGPRSVYARSKLKAENRLREIAVARGASLRIARVFGLVAPGQPPYYVLPALLRRAQEKNLADVPGLSNVRDYLDSRDVCRALLEIDSVAPDRYLAACPDSVLNVASGEGRTIRSIFGLCLEAVHGPEVAAELAGGISEAPARADDVPRIVASLARYQVLFGVGPRTIPLEQTIRDSLKRA